MSGLLADPVVRWIVQSFAATLVIGLLGWVAIRLTRSASVRLAIAAWGLGCCLAIPLLSWLVMQSGQSLTQIEIPTPVAVAELPIQDSIILPAGAPVEVVEVPGEPLVAPTPVEIPWPQIGLGVYLVGVGFGLLRLGGGLVRMHRILRHSQQGPDLNGFDRVRTSDRVIHPFVCGLWRSTLVLPGDLTSRLHPSEFEQVVAHEREHVRGRHAWLGVLQRIATLALWPQPMVHVLARELKAAQEEVCDNAALRGGNPSDYARMLVDLAERRTDRMPSGLAYGIFGSQPPLEKRIRGLLDPRRSTEPTMKHTTRTAVFGTALSMTMILAGVQLVTAQEQVREVIGVPFQTGQAIEVQGYPIAVPVEGVRLQPAKAAKPAKAPKAKKSVRGAKELRAALAEAQRQIRSHEAMLERVQGYKLVPSDQSPLNKIEYKRVPVTTPLTRYRSFTPSTGFTLASPRVKVEGVPILKDVPVIGHLYKGATTVTVPQAESLYRGVSPKVDYLVTQDKPIYKMAAPKLDMSKVKPLYTTPNALAGGTQVIQGERARIVEGRALTPSQPATISVPRANAVAPSDAAIAVAPARTTIKKPAANRKPISVLKGATVILYSDGTTEIRPAAKVTKKPTKAKSTKRGK